MGLFLDKLKEVLRSILPVVIVVAILAGFLLQIPIQELLIFVLCVVLVVIGFTVFLTGVEVGINPMGYAIGNEIPKRKSKIFMVVVVFVISFLVTIAEPDVSVFAKQVNALFSSIDPKMLTYAIAIGVALFLIVAAAKIIYKLSLRAILTISYGIVIVLALILYFTNNMQFLSVAFDSGGVTTGPVTVPILLALGIGICAISGSRNKMEGFGLTGMASVGPIIALLVVGLFTDTQTASESLQSSTVSASIINLDLIWTEFKESVKSVVTALLPLIIFFIIFQKYFLKYSWNAVKDMCLEVGIAGIGIIVFLTGVYAGFMPIATTLGKYLNTVDPIWAILLGLLLGFIVAFAEPAVSILGDQVESSSDGLLSKNKITLLISLGVAAFVALGMARLVYDFNILLILIPGYIVTLILMWIGDKNMVGIAFDAGGVSTGPMSVAILSSIYIGLASMMYTGVDAVINGFGLIALIALAPCLFLSALGVYIKFSKGETDVQ